MYLTFNRILLSIALICLCSLAKAQFTGYTFTQNTSGIYTPITSGTVAASGTGLTDDRFPVTLPFPFVLGGSSYTQAYLCVNGYISLGSTDPGASPYAIASASTGMAMIAGMSTDLASLNSTTELRYETQGLAPNRTFIVQWKNFGYNNSSLLTVNFQVRLSESTNNISVIFGSCTLGGVSSSISVQSGLRGQSNSSFFHRTATAGNWTNTSSAITNTANINYTTNNNPSSGLTYNFNAAPICAAPANQPTGLLLTPTANSVSGSFTASSPAASGYLVVRTNGAPLSTPPVNGTSYSSGSTLGNGIVVGSYAGTNFSHSATSLTSYTYTIFTYNNTSCMLGPAYNTSSPLTGSTFTTGARAYYWQPTSGTASFTTASNWLPVRTFQNATDTLYFNNGGASTVTDVPVQTISMLSVGNGTQVSLKSNSTATLSLNNATYIGPGSTLMLTGSNTLTVTYPNYYSGFTEIYGNLTLDSNAVFNCTNSTVNIYGSLTQRGNSTATQFVSNNTGNGPYVTFAAGSSYNHQRDGGIVPPVKYNPASTVNFTGIVSTAPSYGTNSRFGHFIWDCPGQTSNIILPAFDSVEGNMTINNTNTFLVRVAGKVAGNFIQNNGTVQIGVGVLFSAGGTFAVGHNMYLNSGTFDLNYTTYTSAALSLYGDLTQAAGHIITKSGTGIPTIQFLSTTNQTIQLNGTFNTIPISYTLINPAGATLNSIIPILPGAVNTISAGGWHGTGGFTYSGTAALSYSGGFSVQASNIEWPAANGPSALTVALTGTAPINRIVIPGSRTLSGNLNFSHGVIVLNASDLKVASWSGTAGSLTATDTSMIAADSIGQFQLLVNPLASGNTTYNFPVGDLSGTADRSPLALNVYSNSTSRYIGVHVKNSHHPQDFSTANYLNRYWTVTDDGGSAAMSYKASLNFVLPDTVAGRSFLTNRWNGISWQQMPGTQSNGSTAYYGVLVLGDTLQNSVYPLGGGDYTGRPVASNIYMWNGSLSTDFTTAGNWTPARVAPLPTDILQFNNGITDTVKNVQQPHAITRLSVTGNTTVVMQAGPAAASTYFDIISDHNPATEELFIEQGSTLLINGTTALRMRFSGTDGHITVAGRLEIYNGSGNTNYLTVTGNQLLVTATGTISAGGNTNGTPVLNGADSTNTFIYGTFEHNYAATGAGFMQLNYKDGSEYLIKGFTSASYVSLGEVYNLTYNCPNQAAIVMLNYANLKVRNNFSVISTGTNKVAIGGNSYTTTINNYNQTGGIVDILNTDFTGNFTQSNGTFFASSTSTQTLNFKGTSGIQNVSFKDAAPAGPLLYQVTNPAGINLLGTGTFSSVFNINASGGITIASAATTPVNTLLTLQYSPSATTLTYSAGSNITADANVFPAVNGPARLRVNLSDPQASVTIPFSRTIPDSLMMQSGNINMGANNLVLGTSATTPGGLYYNTTTPGRIQLTSGTLTRWFRSSGLPTSAATGTLGLFPIGYNNSVRTAWIYFSTSTALSSGGTITAGHTNVPGMTNVSVTDGAFVIGKRTNSYWNITTGNGLTLASGSIGLRLIAGDLLTTSSASTLRIMNASGVVGTFVTGGGTSPQYYAERSVLSASDLNSSAFYIGNASSTMSNIWTSVATGNWSTPANWDQGTVPASGAEVIIASGTGITSAGSIGLRSLTTQTGGTLTHTSGTISVDSSILNNGALTITGGTITEGPAGGGKQTFQNNGALTVNSGTLNVNGNLNLAAASYFTQTGGNINVDGNANGNTTLSVQPGTPLVNVSTPNITATGGTLTIIDPPAGTNLTGTNYAFLSSAATTATNFAPAHTLVIGSTSSTTAGGKSDGFIISSMYQQLGSVVINGGSGTNRNVTQGSNLSIGGDFTVADYAKFTDGIVGFSAMFLKGNLNVGYQASFNMTDTICFMDYKLGVRNPAPNPQTVTGIGHYGSPYTLDNTFVSILVNNSSATGVTFNIGNTSFTGTVKFVRGKLNMQSGYLFQPYGYSTGGVTGAGQSTGWVNGPLQLLNTTTGSTFDIGTATYYTPVTLNPNGANINYGSMRMQTFDGDHPNIASGFINPNKSVNYYLRIDTAGAFQYNINSVTVTPQWNNAMMDAGVNFNNILAEKLNGTAWNQVATSFNTPNSVQMMGLGIGIQGIYQVGEAGSTPVILQQPQSQSICTGNNITFSVAASAAVSYQWQINNGGTWTDLSGSAIYSGINMPALIISNVPLGLNGTVYRCAITNALGTVYSDPATLTTAAVLNPSLTITSSATGSICAGTTVTFTAAPVNGGSSPSYQWVVNGINAGYNTSTLTLSPLANINVFCVMTTFGGCTPNNNATSPTISVNVNPVISPSISVSTNTTGSICAGTQASFTAMTNVSGGTYQWKVNGANSGTNSNIFSYTPVNNDIINCIVTAPSGSCYTTAQQSSYPLTLTVTPVITPAISISTVSTTVCAGSSVTYTATTNVNTPSLQWKVNGINVASGTATYAYTPANGDAVTCEVTAPAGSCVSTPSAASNTVTMVVNPLTVPSASVSASAAAVCAGTTITCTVTSNITSGNYQWRVNNVNVGSNSTTYSFTPANGDLVTCVHTATAGCYAPDSVAAVPLTINVTPVTVPTVAITTGNTAPCAGTSVTYTAVSNVAGISYQWSVNSTNAGTNTSTYNYAPQNGDHVICTITMPATGCYTTNTVTSLPLTANVTSPVLPTATVSTPTTTLCAGSLAALSCTTNVTGATYNWLINGTTSGNNSSTYSYVPQNGDLVSCSITAPSGGCYTSGTVTSTAIGLTVNQPVTPALTISGPSAVSAGTAVTVNAALNNAGSVYHITWMKNGQLLNTTTIPSTTYTKTAGTADTLTATVAPVGCYNTAASNTIVITDIASGVETLWVGKVTVYPNPADNTLYIDGAATAREILFTDLAGRIVARWNVNGGTHISLQLPEINTGLYMLTIKDGNNVTIGVEKIEKH